ncbi:MAG: HU family DNA-binding protein [Oscillospiraceae bacterium]|nr:HU family DNA-binding protein [Oscillospiraceae bacterium]
MNRKEFVKEVSKRKGLSKTRAYRSVSAVMDTIRMALLNGNEVEIGGFGTFAVVTDLKGERIPVFKAGRALKNIVNVNGGNE